MLAAATPASSFVETVERFVDETDLSVWQRIVGGLTSWSAWWRATPPSGCTHGSPRWWDPPAPGSVPTSGQMATTTAPGRCGACSCRRQRCWVTTGGAERSAELLDAYLADPGGVDPSLAAAALVVSATLGDEALHERLVERFRAADNPQDRERLLLALSLSEPPASSARWTWRCPAPSAPRMRRTCCGKR